MFGIYRTLLALFVVASHLMSITIIGQYAVHGFFILSGYLMTLINPLFPALRSSPRLRQAGRSGPNAVPKAFFKTHVTPA